MLPSIKSLIRVCPIRLSRKAIYLAISLLFSSGALVSGQVILFLELKSLTLAHCRRLNLQNIFFYNQSISSAHSQLSQTQHLNDDEYTAPEYCLTFLRADQAGSKQTNSKDYINNLSADLKLRIYADSYADAEMRYSDKQMNLLILLLAFNVLSLLFQSIHLYQDSKEIN